MFVCAFFWVACSCPQSGGFLPRFDYSWGSFAIMCCIILSWLHEQYCCVPFWRAWHWNKCPKTNKVSKGAKIRNRYNQVPQSSRILVSWPSPNGALHRQILPILQESVLLRFTFLTSILSHNTHVTYVRSIKFIERTYVTFNVFSKT